MHGCAADNILVNADTHELKLADFGSAKKMVPGAPSVAHVSTEHQSSSSIERAFFF